MKTRVKQKVVKELNFDLSEAEDKIFRMYGSQWFGKSVQEKPHSDKDQPYDKDHQLNIDEHPRFASQHDLEEYIDDPYEIEDLPNDVILDSNVLLTLRPDASNEIQLSNSLIIPSSQGMTSRGQECHTRASHGLASRRFGSSRLRSRGRASHGRTLRGLASRGRALRGRPSRGRTTRRLATRGRKSPGCGERNFATEQQVRQVS